MLTQLTIRHYALIQELCLDFGTGMTVITGETGAGKSILIDALGLCLGERAESTLGRTHGARTELSACFQVANNPQAYQWLVQQQLQRDDSCILRRVLTADGRSRSFINGTPVPLIQLRELGDCLVQIHGQHAHQQLLKNRQQRELLDQFAQHHQLVEALRHAVQQWLTTQRCYLQQQQQAEAATAQAELLRYQLEELQEFAAQPHEYQNLVEEHQQLARYSDRLLLSQQLLQCLVENDDHNLSTLLGQATQQMRQLLKLDERLVNLLSMLEEAAIQVTETAHELQIYYDRLTLDPERLAYLEQRIAKTIQLARKHQIAPETLPDRHQQLQQAWEALEQQAVDQQAIKQQLVADRAAVQQAAATLTQSRQQAAEILAQRLTTTLQHLALPHAQFAITIIPNPPDQWSTQSGDRVEFLVTTNPGQPLQPLSKVASGGELSRIALAIRLLTAQKRATPSLIFDEVDAGISGRSALAVGQHLRQLGEITQVFCVTHLPQVAGCGHHHLLVKKQSHPSDTTIQLKPLEMEQRLQELARLIAGATITPQTLATARELLVTG
jgi:DNA repair protein RecN (Recombination protein N)